MDGNNMNYQYGNTYQQQGRGMGIASMVLGIIALVITIISCCLPFGYLLASVLGLLSIIFGIIAIAKKSGKGMGIAGIICSVVGLLLAIIMIVFSLLLGAGIIAAPAFVTDYDYDEYYYDYDYDYDDYDDWD